MKKMISAFAVLALAVGCSSKPMKTAFEEETSPSRMPAADCIDGKDRGEKGCRDARKGDWVTQYALDENGNFWALKRKTDGKILPCQLTNNVDSFKISQHKNDNAAVYMMRDNNLVYMKVHTGSPANECPSKAQKEQGSLMANVKEYSVVSNTNTDIVNVALDKSGNMQAWDHAVVRYKDNGVKDFMMNTCFNQDGKTFKNYVMFSIDSDGHVTKIKGELDGETLAASKKTQESYRDIQEFKKSQKVCEAQN